MKQALRKRIVYSEAPASARTRVWLPPEPTPGQKCLRVAIVGAPNAGKSTLLNQLLGSRVSAVSAKYNTTRDRVLGVYTDKATNTQLVFTDTPGFVPETGTGSARYSASLVRAAREAVPESDVVLLVIDGARRFEEEQQGTLDGLATLCANAGAALFVVVNKADLLRGQNLTRAVGLLKVAAMGGLHKAAGTLPSEGSDAAATSDKPLWLSPEEMLQREKAATDSASSSSSAADTSSTSVDADDSAEEINDDADTSGSLAHLTAATKAELSSPISSSRRPHDRKDLERRVLSTKLELLRDAFETAAFKAGLVGPGGFDDPLLGRRRRKSETVGTVSSSAVSNTSGASSLSGSVSPQASWSAASYAHLDPAWAALRSGSTDADIDDEESGGEGEGSDYDSGDRRRNAHGERDGSFKVGAAAAQPGPSSSLSSSDPDRHALAVPPSAIYKVLPPVFPIAARQGEGVEELRSALVKLAPSRGWEYSWRQTTDLSPLERLAEVVREKLFQHLHREVPYRIRQENRSWRLNEAGELVVDQDIQVPSRAVARMLTARSGGPIKTITSEAIRDLEPIMGRRVHLFLHITVKERLAEGRAVAGGLDG